MDRTWKNTTLRQLGSLSRVIAHLAAKLAPATAEYALDRVLDLAEQTTIPHMFGAMAPAIPGLVNKLDSQTAKYTVARILAGSIVDAHDLQTRADSIIGLAEKLDRETMGAAAGHMVARALDLAENDSGHPQVHVLASVSIGFAARLDLEAANHTVDSVVDLVERTTLLRTLTALAGVMASLADNLDAHTIREAAKRTVVRALYLASQTTDPEQLQAGAQAIEALAPRLATAPILFAAIQILQPPLGGDEQVTEILLRTIATALDRPDLLRPFPEQSFWAVMQHLAELKAANPDWDWLDLARPPLPSDELLATFRRLCADPPD